jgi:hypothetical protein
VRHYIISLIGLYNSISTSLYDSINQSTHDFISTSLYDSINLSTHYSINRFIYDSINQYTHDSINRFIYDFINQYTHNFTNTYTNLNFFAGIYPTMINYILFAGIISYLFAGILCNNICREFTGIDYGNRNTIISTITSQASYISTEVCINEYHNNVIITVAYDEQISQIHVTVMNDHERIISFMPAINGLFKCPNFSFEIRYGIGIPNYVVI